MAFADLFEFSRARTGAYRSAGGAVLIAPIDAPRFDHRPSGAPRGLLIEARSAFGAGDKFAAKEAAWPATPGTVLHEYETPAGEIRRRAFYAIDPRGVIDGLVNTRGWQRRVGVIPGYLRNRGGYVSYLDDRYKLGGVLAVAPHVLLDALGGDAATPLIEG